METLSQAEVGSALQVAFNLQQLSQVLLLIEAPKKSYDACTALTKIELLNRSASISSSCFLKLDRY